MAWLYLDPKDEDALAGCIAEIENSQSDRAVAIVAGSFLEDQLTKAIQRRLHHHTKITPELFRESGPLGSFGTKVNVAFVLGICSEAAYAELSTITRIRNAFAHQLAVNRFGIQRIAALCNNLNAILDFQIRVESNENSDASVILIPEDVDFKNPKVRFVESCKMYIALLGQRVSTELNKPLF